MTVPVQEVRKAIPVISNTSYNNQVIYCQQYQLRTMHSVTFCVCKHCRMQVYPQVEVGHYMNMCMIGFMKPIAKKTEVRINGIVMAVLCC